MKLRWWQREVTIHVIMREGYAIDRVEMTGVDADVDALLQRQRHAIAIDVVRMVCSNMLRGSVQSDGFLHQIVRVPEKVFYRYVRDFRAFMPSSVSTQKDGWPAGPYLPDKGDGK